MKIARDILAVACSVALGGGVLWLSTNRAAVTRIFAAPAKASVPREPMVVPDGPLLGAATAPALMLVFSDFECPFCAHFATALLPRLQAEFITPGTLQVVYQHLPLPIHRVAERAAILSACAAEQGRFWPFHDRLFARRGLTEAVLQASARETALDLPALTACSAGPGMTTVAADGQRAAALNLRETPSFVLGTRLRDGRFQPTDVLIGVAPYERFVNAIRTANSPPR